MAQRENKALLLAVLAGEIMLKSGAETYRVEDAVTQVSRSCDVAYVECFATPSGIFVSLGQDGPGERRDTIIKRVKRIGIDLEKISRVNTFIRNFSAGKLSIDEGLEELARIDATEGFSLPVRLLALMLVGSCFTLMNSGSYADGLCALLIGVVTYLLSLGIERLRINHFIVIFASCFVGAGLSFLAFSLGFGSSLGAIIVGSITIFLPGVAITNAARDLLSNDMLSGVSRVTESMLIAVAIAGGVGLLLRLAPLAPHSDAVIQHLLILKFVFAFLGTMGVSIIVNIPRRYLVVVSLIAACGWIVLELFTLSTGMRVFGCFVGACTIALIAEIATRITKEAATLFIIPAIFPLVPGIAMYNTMRYLIDSNLDAAVAAGSQALFMAGGIAFALLIVISLTRIASVIYAQLRKRPT
jgi:uncharacterized membrane protein YjjP (DUF1212 family)